jgi:hypothetical protein
MVALLSRMEKMQASYWQDRKRKELKDLIAACAGLWFEAYTTEPTYATGAQMNVRSQVISREGLNISLTGLWIAQTDMEVKTPKSLTNLKTLFGPLAIPNKDKTLPANEMQTFNTTATANAISQPYWLALPHPIGTYQLTNPYNAGYPENPDPTALEYEFMIEGHAITYDRSLVYKYVDPAKGEIYQPLEITPPITANLASAVYVFAGKQQKVVQIKLKSFVAGSGSVSINPLPGWTVSPAKIAFADKKKGDEWTAEFVVSPTDNQPKTAVLTAAAEINGQTSSLGIQRIRYDHVPNITLFPPAQAKMVSVDLKLNAGSTKIGYIAGAGDLVPEALKQVGYDVHVLTENDIMTGNLSEYAAIISGVRAYNVNPRLVVEQPRLMEYVKNGGNLMVQYNTPTNLVTNQIGPYPFRIGGDRVTDENAKVTFTEPASPVLNFPNKITQADFEGWVQERGLYFTTGLDPKYQTPFEMNDAGEAPNRGSLIYTEYGRGRFVYTSLDFFRELPAGVPGAYRLFVNLMSAPPQPVKMKKEK